MSRSKSTLCTNAAVSCDMAGYSIGGRRVSSSFLYSGNLEQQDVFNILRSLFVPSLLRIPTATPPDIAEEQHNPLHAFLFGPAHRSCFPLTLIPDARSPSALYPSHILSLLNDSAEKTTSILDSLMVLAWLDF
ncbi:hypothetical protein DEU56DRAFT_913874 [Suillus clintonianus]|uniref:uncharacterized protein n=1 Tax=Suillus clintonianus TaxID=1904413 RepID=UPI001B88091C|nr:uncharacterized protein DEU56DRAFT_913874 [Suillus clintonianus]KAG2133756.1 hypothetical protein DEU56DRAFT_913874 [Suillus clintonianus]